MLNKIVNAVCSVVVTLVAFIWLALLITLNGVVWQEYLRYHTLHVNNWKDVLDWISTVILTFSFVVLGFTPFMARQKRRKSK